MRAYVRPGVLVFAVAILILGGTEAGHASPGIISPSTASALADAMNVPAGDIVSASLGTSDSLGTGVADTALSFFPRVGGTFAILSSGLAASADDPDTNNSECLGCGGDSDDVSYILGGLNNSQGNDLVQLSLTLNVPEAFGCLAFDFAFYSEEFPDYINSQFNDTFIAEVGPPGSASTFTIVGDDVVAPNNIAFDTNGHTLDVNSAFGFDPGNPNPDTGTTYDGTSGLLMARSQVTPGTEVEIVFSIMDLGDSILDSAVFLDNFRWTTDPPAVCQPGAEPMSAGHWKLDEGSGTTAYDSSENGNHGTLINGPSWTSGKIDGALSFDGADDYVQVPDSNSLDLTNALTLAMWFKPAINIPSPYDYFYTLLMKWHGTGDQWRTGYVLQIYSLGVAPGSVHFIRGHGSGQWGGLHGTQRTWNAGQWYHVAVTYDTSLPSGNAKIYVNGVLDAQDDENRALAVNSLDFFINADPFEVGWHPQVKYFPGVIDDVRVYNRALSAAEIAQLAQAPICGNTLVEPPEQCDPPQANSSWCPQSSSWCSGPTLCVRDAYGDCTSQCACSYDDASCACQVGQCGAQCAVDADCPAGWVCTGCICVPGKEVDLACLTSGDDPDITDPSCVGADPYAAGESADMIARFTIPHPSMQFAPGLLVGFLDPDFQMIGGSDVGALLGKLRSDTFLGTLNNPCNVRLDLTFDMYNGTTDSTDTFVVDPDHGNVMDDDCHAGNNLPNHVDCYPDYNNVIFDPDGAGPKDPIEPLTRLTGYQTVAGQDILIQFMLFDKGALADAVTGFAAPHPYSQFDASWGYPSVIMLLNPSAPAAPSAINFFCSPLVTRSTLFAKSQDNTATAADEGGVVVRQNPAATGTAYYHYFALSYRNADEDPWENNYDSCTGCYNYDDQFLVDSDGDMIDPCCDTVAYGTSGPAVDDGDDIDGDGYLNGNDNCTMTYNPYPQNEAELSAPWPADAGPRADQAGDDCDGPGALILPSAPTAESGAGCNNNVDDDHDGWFDEGCDSDADFANGTYRAAFTLLALCIGGIDTDGDGWCDDDETTLGSNPNWAPGGDHDGDGFANPPYHDNGGGPGSAYPYNPCTAGSTTDCVDNCPIDYNPTQADADSDGIGDACDLYPSTTSGGNYDGDPYNDNADPCPQHKLVDLLSSQDDDGDGLGDGCDPMPNTDFSPFGRPENISLQYDTYLNDAGARPIPDEKIAMDGVQQVCDDGIDNDGDGWVDAYDSGCSGAQANDRDGDGATDGEEWWTGTDRLDACGNDCDELNPNTADHDAWPYDINRDCWCNASDILMFPAQIDMPIQRGAPSAHPYQQRYDLDPDNWINSQDILMLPARVLPSMPKQCTNP